jgi:hypothetical protein
MRTTGCRRRRSIVMANRAQGPDYVMQVFEERAPEGFAKRA